MWCLCETCEYEISECLRVFIVTLRKGWRYSTINFSVFNVIYHFPSLMRIYSSKDMLLHFENKICPFCDTAAVPNVIIGNGV